LDDKIKEIESLCWATEPSVLYLTGDRKLIKSVNKKRKFQGEKELEFKPNFRFATAKKKEYKGTRNPEKPFHYNNIREYMLANYECIISEGMEADDMICVELVRNGERLDVICCSRDKDLRMVPGMHFGWECGRQPQFGPKRVDFIGEISLSTEREMFECVAGLYEKKYGEDWRTEFREQADLLWMIRELDEEGCPVKYVMYDERNDYAVDG
jgi:hypothetical protein